MNEFNNGNQGMTNDETSGISSTEAMNAVEGVSGMTSNEAFNAVEGNPTGSGVSATDNVSNNDSQDNSNPYGPYTGTVEGAPEDKATLAIVSLCTGIGSILMSCCCGFLGLPLSIAAIITGVLCKKNNKPGQGMALAGIITGAVGVVTFLISVFFNAAVLFSNQ